ncbi:MAG: hypothetical protein AAGU75_13850 [Bacillota bacterium]|uniref:hypothetical protein n=1 Tax=Desulfitobacterium hafniense TaxID=49338 RepID=UPI0003783574|nr:hypothetical protein [Desulfitobacterium hafniense]
MSGGIFLLQDNGQVVDMRQQPFQSEEFLQHLVAEHPELLVGDQFGNSSPRRFLLISREMGLASEENGGDRWAIDHLFVDQDAVLTVVEVKRSSDTRIRREVVGQMLDYASNAVAYLPIEKMRNRFELTHYEPEERFAEFIGDDAIDYDTFWENVKTNIQANKIRLLFIADEIPQELRRIIEFLNGNMSSVEVLGIEIKQYVNRDTGLKTLVPRVVGHTVEAQRVKRSYSRTSDAELGEIRDSILVQLVTGQYRIDQYMDYTVKIYDNNGDEVKAKPILRKINEELGLGVTEINSNGNYRNTRQLGNWIIKEFRKKGKFINLT